MIQFSKIMGKNWPLLGTFMAGELDIIMLLHTHTEIQPSLSTKSLHNLTWKLTLLYHYNLTSCLHEKNWQNQFWSHLTSYSQQHPIALHITTDLGPVSANEMASYNWAVQLGDRLGYIKPARGENNLSKLNTSWGKKPGCRITQEFLKL